MSDFECSPSSPGSTRGTAIRLLSCIRYDEVLVLQGAPLFGACFSAPGFSMASLWTAAALVVGNSLLIAHVFLLNDWSGIDTDVRDPTRAARTFLSRGTTAPEMLGFSLLLGLLAIALFAAIDRRVPAFGLAIVGLSALYSLPAIQGKGVPVLNSILHLVGGTAHFLLGYAAFAPISAYAVGIACFFGLSFAAGHLTHEARDHQADRSNGITTNAVTFGVRPVFFASMIGFTLAYALLIVLAVTRVVPFALVSVAGLYPLHMLAFHRAMRTGLTYESLRQLQSRYRWIYATIGLVMLAAVLSR